MLKYEKKSSHYTKNNHKNLLNRCFTEVMFYFLLELSGAFPGALKS